MTLTGEERMGHPQGRMGSATCPSPWAVPSLFHPTPNGSARTRGAEGDPRSTWQLLRGLGLVSDGCEQKSGSEAEEGIPSSGLL